MYYHNESYSNNHANHESMFSGKFSGLLGINLHKFNSKNKASLYLTLNRITSRLKSQFYQAYGEKLNRLAYRAATKGNEYLEIGMNHDLVFKNQNALTLELAVREDLVLNLKNFDDILEGRNAEDFGVFLGLRYAMP